MSSAYSIEGLSPVDVAIRFGGGTLSLTNPFLLQGLWATDTPDTYTTSWGRSVKRGTLCGQTVVEGHWLPAERMGAIQVPKHWIGGLAGMSASVAAMAKGMGNTSIDFVERSYLPHALTANEDSIEQSRYGEDSYHSDMGTSWQDDAGQAAYGILYKQRLEQFVTSVLLPVLNRSHCRFIPGRHEPIALLALWMHAYGKNFDCESILQDVQNRLTYTAP